MCKLTASTPRGKVNADLKYDNERGWVRCPGHDLAGDENFHQFRVERPKPDERAGGEGGLADTVGLHGEPPAGKLWVITHANDLTYYRDGHDCTPEAF